MLLSVLLAMATAAAPVRGDSLVAMPMTPESRIWFDGSSNIRHFTCRARELLGTFVLLDGTGASALVEGAHPAILATIAIPVSALDCGIGLMNGHLREALRGSAHPRIEFRTTAYGISADGDSATASVDGALAIAGRESVVTVPGVVRRGGDGRLHLTGAYALRVRDFGVEPPRRFFGLLRVRDRVVVHFDLLLPA